jgi:hypothetical protein
VRTSHVSGEECLLTHPMDAVASETNTTAFTARQLSQNTTAMSGTRANCNFRRITNQVRWSKKHRGQGGRNICSPCVMLRPSVHLFASKRTLSTSNNSRLQAREGEWRDTAHPRPQKCVSPGPGFTTERDQGSSARSLGLACSSHSHPGTPISDPRSLPVHLRGINVSYLPGGCS